MTWIIRETVYTGEKHLNILATYYKETTTNYNLAAHTTTVKVQQFDLTTIQYVSE